MDRIGASSRLRYSLLRYVGKQIALLVIHPGKGGDGLAAGRTIDDPQTAGA